MERTETCIDGVFGFVRFFSVLLDLEVCRSGLLIVAITMNLLAVHLIFWGPSNSEARIISKALEHVEE